MCWFYPKYWIFFEIEFIFNISDLPSKSISCVWSCNLWLRDCIELLWITWNTKGLSSLSSSLTLGCLYHGGSLSIISIWSLCCLLLLHCYGKLTSCPSSLCVSSVVYSLSSKSSLSWLSFCGRSVSLVSRSTNFISKTIHHLSSKICSVFFSFFNEFLVCRWFYLIVFSLHFSNRSASVSSAEVFFWNSLTCLFEHPIVLIVIIMTSLIHQIFENFSHIIVIRSFFKFQISTVL